jgi:hypothetical protein
MDCLGNTCLPADGNDAATEKNTMFEKRES